MENQMQQYQPNMVQVGQPHLSQEMQQQYQQPQLPQMPQTHLPQTHLPQMPQVGQMQMSPMQYPQQQQMQQQIPDLAKVETPSLNNQNYHPLRLTCDEPEKEVMGGTGPKADPPMSKAAQYYFNIPIKSNYGSSVEKDVRTFFYEGCELTTLYGIKSETNQYGKWKSTIAFSLDQRDPDQVKFISDFDMIQAGAAQLLFHFKDKVNYPLFNNDNPKMAQATGFRQLLTRKAGKNPALYGDLIDYTGDTFSVKTPFTYEKKDGTVVTLDWKDLKGMTFKCIPLFRFKQIWVAVGGGKAALQWDIKSVIVTSEPVPFKAISMQADTSRRIAEQRPDWSDTIEAQIAKNNMANQDKKLGSELYIAPKTESNNQINPSIETSPQNITSNPQNTTATTNTSVQSGNLEQFMNTNTQPVIQFS
jgi:hypothetical protein